METKTIQIMVREKKHAKKHFEDVKALCFNDCFAIHISSRKIPKKYRTTNPSNTYTITHIPTGYALAIFDLKKQAVAALTNLLEVFPPECALATSKDYDEIVKCSKSRVCGAYLSRMAKIYSNERIESIAGSFNADRQEAEELLKSLN